MLQVRLAEDLPADAEREAVYLSSALTVWVLAAVAMLAARSATSLVTELRLVSLLPEHPAPRRHPHHPAGLAVMAVARLLKVQETRSFTSSSHARGRKKLPSPGYPFPRESPRSSCSAASSSPPSSSASGSMEMAVAVSVVVFAATHAYQGWTGGLRVGILGLILTIPFLSRAASTPPSSPTSTSWPSSPGWCSRTGCAVHGRRASSNALSRITLPPIQPFRGPAWNRERPLHVERCEGGGDPPVGQGARGREVEVMI
jgi:hypothetical protein